MRTARIRTAWKNKRREISIEEHAAAVAAVAWRVALNAAKNLHAQEFAYESDAQRMGVIREYLYFFIHVADRSMPAPLGEARRARFITALAHECRRHTRENERDIMAHEMTHEMTHGEMTHGADAGQFIWQLNQRAARYATTRFVAGNPGYEAFRALGLRIQECMGHSQPNKWAQDQITEIDGPEATRIFSRALAALNESAMNKPAKSRNNPANE